MANSRTEQKALTRARILRAANALFLDNGYENAKTTQLACMVGISHGTIFAHFDSKASILRELVLKRMRADLAVLRKIELQGETSIEKIKDLIRRLWFRAQYAPELTFNYHSQSWLWSVEEEESFQELMSITIRIARDIIEAGIESGEISSEINTDLVLDLLQAKYFDAMRRLRNFKNEDEAQSNQLNPLLIEFEQAIDYLLK